MTRYEYRLKTILPALLAVLSLLALTAPTCLCAHHEVKTAAVSCHSASHGTASTPEGIAADSDCICVFAERPSAADKSTPENLTKEAVVLAAAFTATIELPFAQQSSPQLARVSIQGSDPPDPASVHSRGPPA